MYANPFWRFLLKRLGNDIEKFVVVSEHTYSLVTQRFPAWKERITVIRPGLNKEWLSIPISDNQSDRINLLMVARLHPRKGQLDVLRALEQVKAPGGKKITCTIVGTGNRKQYTQALQDAARDSCHEVNLAGEQTGSRLKQAFSEADIFVMASREDPHSIESFGIVYLEAAAAGLPVIACDVGGVREAVLAGETAIIVPPGDPDALTDAIQDLVDDPQLRESLGNQGRRFASSLSWQTSASLLMDA